MDWCWLCWASPNGTFVYDGLVRRPWYPFGLVRIIIKDIYFLFTRGHHSCNKVGGKLASATSVGNSSPFGHIRKSCKDHKSSFPSHVGCLTCQNSFFVILHTLRTLRKDESRKQDKRAQHTGCQAKASCQ